MTEEDITLQIETILYMCRWKLKEQTYDCKKYKEEIALNAKKKKQKKEVSKHISDNTIPWHLLLEEERR